MKGFRDTMQPGPHAVRLDDVPLTFGAEGVLWEPTPEQEAVLTKDATRAGRFEPVEPMGKSPAADEPVTGAALFGGEGDAPTGEETETGRGGRRRRQD